MLSETEAWREIAERVAASGLHGAGLCFAIHRLFDTNRITIPVYRQMQSRVQVHADASEHRYQVGPYAGWFAYRPGRERAPRILAALWLACEAEDDGGAA